MPSRRCTRTPGRSEQAEELFKEVAAADPPNAEHLLAYAGFIVGPIISRLKSGVVLAHQMSQEYRERLERAISLLTQTDELLRGTEDTENLCVALNNRAIAKMVLEEYEDALLDINMVIDIDDSFDLALVNKGMILLKLGRLDVAEEAFRRARDSGLNRNSIVQKIAECCAFRDKNDAAIAVIKEVIPAGEEEEITAEELPLAITLGEIYVGMDDYEKAGDLLEKLHRIYPGKPEILVLSGHLAMGKGDRESAGAFFTEAHERSSENDLPRTTLELADFHYECGDFHSALPLYNDLVNMDVVNSLLRRYLTCLLNTGQPGECLRIARDVRNHQDVSVMEMEAVAFDRLGQLDQAIEVFDKLAQINPEKADYYLVRKGVCLFRVEKLGEAEATLKEAVQRGIDSPLNLMTVAQVFSMMKLSWEAIDLAYQAIRLAPNDPQISLAYTGVFLDRSQIASCQLDREEVGIDSTVTFKSGTDTWTYTIVGEESSSNRDEISASSDLAKALIGHKQDEEFEVDVNGRKAKLKILEVKSKYVHAFQASLGEFNSRFLGEDGLEQISVEGDDFSEIFKRLDRAAQLAEERIEEYQRTELPISCFAKLLGRDLFTTWLGLTSIPELRVRSSYGNVEEQQAEIATAQTAKEVVVDLVTLFTLGLLGALDVLPKMFNVIYVHQHSLDQLNDIQNIHTFNTKSKSTAAKVGDG